MAHRDPASSQTYGRPWSRKRGWRGLSHASADRTLDPLKGALLDLTDPLARNPIFPGELVEGLRFVREHARLKDCAFACRQHVEGLPERALPSLIIIALAQYAFRVWRGIDQAVLPFFRCLRVTDRDVERGIAAQAAVHLDDVRRAHIEMLRDIVDLLRPQIAFLGGGDPGLESSKIKEQLLLGSGGSHLDQRPRSQDVFLTRGLDPPPGIGSQAKAFIGFKAFDG